MKNKKNYLILIPLTLVLILAIIIINKKEPVDPIENPLFNQVDSYNEFFKVDKVINDYIDKIDSGTIDNNYFANKVYLMELNRNKYYLAIGDMEEYNYSTSKMVMQSNIAYLINIITADGDYEIKEVDDYNKYLSGNEIKDNVDVKSIGNYYNYDFSINDRAVVSHYINYFKELLFVNYTKAYSFLDVNYKRKIGSIEEFNVKREELYKKISDIYTDYSIKGEDGNKTIRLLFEDNNEIVIKENGIMDFTFSYVENG